MDDHSITISQALNQIQSWLNAGDHEKVIKGCTEILQIEPGNNRALALMKKAEELRQGITNPIVSQEVPSPTPPPLSAADPLADLQVENTPGRFHKDHSYPRSDRTEKRRLFLAMLIPAILVVLMGGAIIWFFTNEKRDELLSGTVDEEITPTRNAVYLKDNDERIDALTQMTEILKRYQMEHGAYPSLDEVEKVLTKGKTLQKVPVDPRQGEVDKAGKEFGYVYAVYPSFGEANKIYILSALFEDSKGFGYAWTTGGPSKNHPDYRDVDESHASFLGDSR